MAVQPAAPLQEQIDRAQVGDQEIEVEVEALLDDLRRDQQPALALGARPVVGQDLALDGASVAAPEPRMEQLRRKPRGNGRFEGSLRFSDGVANPTDCGAGANRLGQNWNHRPLGLASRQPPNGYASIRRS